MVANTVVADTAVANTAVALPLHGVRVADLTRFVAGSQATMWLTALGADVVKVEPPAGDPYRVQGTERSDGESVLFAALNAGKRSLACDSPIWITPKVSQEASIPTPFPVLPSATT